MPAIATMETINPEQFLTLGAISIAIVGVVVLASFALMVGSLKLAISFLSDASPGYLACFGSMVAVYFINSFIVVVANDLLGITGILLALPVTCFVAIHSIRRLANCGVLSALCISFIHSILYAVGMLVMIALILVPLAALVPDSDKGAQAEIHDVDEMLTEMEAQMQELDSQRETLDQMEIPEIKQVHFEPEQTVTETRNSETTFAPTPSAEPARRVPVPSSRPRTKTVRRAADGSMVNPFFQD